jgi:hypothetical protein
MFTVCNPTYALVFQLLVVLFRYGAEVTFSGVLVLNVKRHRGLQAWSWGAIVDVPGWGWIATQELGLVPLES